MDTKVNALFFVKNDKHHINEFILSVQPTKFDNSEYLLHKSIVPRQETKQTIS